MNEMRGRRLRILCMYALFSGALGLENTHGRSYVLTDLGTIGGANSFGQGINDLGEIVGWTDTATNPRAFLWLPDFHYGRVPGMGFLEMRPGDARIHPDKQTLSSVF